MILWIYFASCWILLAISWPPEEQPYSYNESLIMNLHIKELTYQVAVWDKGLPNAEQDMNDWFIFDLLDWNIQAFSLDVTDSDSGEYVAFDTGFVNWQREEYIHCNREEKYNWSKILVSHLEDYEMFFFTWKATNIEGGEQNHSHILGLVSDISERIIAQKDIALELTVEHLQDLNLTSEELVLVSTQNELPISFRHHGKLLNCIKPYEEIPVLIVYEVYANDLFFSVLIILCALLILAVSIYKENSLNNRVYPFVM